ncbi:retron St85 family effector protein [Massilia sp. H6]|uniref:retron St85 family effector protein n=1 Tax=Massilia sp. H6 TaxID=2970464 RepID=UPI0021688879|nr:retron St85 family effector protein [Massilia sp. H6]UVW29857.1 retron St85 family effector protein [Massilia sp. H6]
MIKKLSMPEILMVAKVVEEKIYSPSKTRKVAIFLCGADINDKSKARSKLADILAEKKRYEVFYPEDIFDDLLVGPGHSLLTLESILADSVDAIVIFPESPGSLAEMGAFSNDERLRDKLICFANKKYQKNKSFINYGPLRLIKSSRSGTLAHVNYDDLDDSIEAAKIYDTFVDGIAKIKKFNPTRRHIGNILEAENFLLPCIYLVNNIDNVSMYKILEETTKLDAKFCEIATRSALGRLMAKRFITRNLTGYSITMLGTDHVRGSFGHRQLDAARVEILNFEQRSNSAIKCDRMRLRTFSK